MAAWAVDGIERQQGHGKVVFTTSFHSGSKSNPAKNRHRAAGPERPGIKRNAVGSSTQGGVQQLLTCTPDTPLPPLGVRLAVVACVKFFVVSDSMFAGAESVVW